jgi:hypothetical protein
VAVGGGGSSGEDSAGAGGEAGRTRGDRIGRKLGLGGGPLVRVGWLGSEGLAS